MSGLQINQMSASLSNQNCLTRLVRFIEESAKIGNIDIADERNDVG
jgi:hypothetical protein